MLPGQYADWTFQRKVNENKMGLGNTATRGLDFRDICSIKIILAALECSMAQGPIDSFRSKDTRYDSYRMNHIRIIVEKI